ncbi:MAG: hypothetical protein Q8O43_08660, partial [Dehalococcoidia bacterium]|nr:hypothetical protein [Dehalococcoidia bacterium]
MTDSLKQRLSNRLRQIGALEVRISDPHIGWEHALPGQHPLTLWPQCKSIIVFAVAMSPAINNTYLGPYAPWQAKNRNLGPVPTYIQSEEHALDRMSRIFVANITLKGMFALAGEGVGIGFALPQVKLAAAEAGLGVYGKSGVIINPVLGNRMNIGVIMTDVVIDPDGRLTDFTPCTNCDICIRSCPAKVFDPAKSYPESYNRERCIAKRAEIEGRGLYCHNCFASCPAGKINDEKLLSIQTAPSFYKRDRLPR